MGERRECVEGGGVGGSGVGDGVHVGDDHLANLDHIKNTYDHVVPHKTTCDNLTPLNTI